MNRKLLVLLTVMFSFALVRVALASPPAPPHAFQGSVLVNGVAPANGTVITATVTDATDSASFTTTTFSDGMYWVSVSADNPDTPAYDGGTGGDAISFEIAGLPAEQTAAFSSSEMDTLNLTTAAAGTETTVSIDESGNVTVTLAETEVANGLEVRFDAANNRFIFTDPNVTLTAEDGAIQIDAHTFAISADDVTGDITVSGGSADDTLTVDTTGGNAFPSGTIINFDGDDGGNDTLIIRSESGSGRRKRVVVNHINASDGQVQVGDVTVNYMGLEPITFIGTPVDVSIDLTSGADAATWTQIGSLDNRIDGATFEQTNFHAPQENSFVLITMNMGDDSFQIDDADLMTNTAIIVNGNGGTDSMTWNATERIVTQTMTLTVGVETFNFGAASTFPVTLRDVHDRVVLTETTSVNLNGATLALDVADQFDASGKQFTLIENTEASSMISGTFAGLAEGARVMAGGEAFTISYAGGDGNDVVISQVNLVVSTLDDEQDGDVSVGDNSLREAIANADDGDTITFDAALSGGTIDVSTLGTLIVIDDITISSTVPITISGGDAVRVMQVGTVDGAELTLNHLTIANGAYASTTGVGGAGVYVRKGKLTLTNSTVRDNALTGEAYGGGVAVNAGESLVVEASWFEGNSADSGTGDFGGGGAIGSDGTAVITNSTFISNTAAGLNVAVDAGAGGGAISSSDDLTIVGSTFVGNDASASYYGSGAVDTFGTATIVNSTFVANTAGGDPSAPFSFGGAVGNAGTLTVRNSTFSDNEADFGGAVANFADLFLYNNILANSVNGSDCFNDGVFSGAVAMGDNNLIELDDGDEPCAADVVSSAEPDLQPLGDNGGPTHTMALAKDSPAIDLGASATCATADQRGESRDDLNCDLGAYELKLDDSITVVLDALADGAAATFGPTRVGITRTGGMAPGVITVTKRLIETNDPEGFDIIWTINADVQTGLDLIVSFCYLESEIPAAIAAKEAIFSIYRQPDSGGAYSELVTTVDEANNCVSAAVTGFSNFRIGAAAPTAVVLDYFAASAENSTVTIDWATASEIHLAGFNLYRRAANSRDAWEAVNAQLIASRGAAAQGSRYQFVDTDVPAGTWHYLLEDVETDGKTFRHVDSVVTVSVTSVPTAVAFVGSSAEITPRISIALLLAGVVFLSIVSMRIGKRSQSNYADRKTSDAAFRSESKLVAMANQYQKPTLTRYRAAQIRQAIGPAVGSSNGRSLEDELLFDD